MGVCPDIGVYTECHTGRFALAPGQFVYHVKFGNTLHIEAENILVYAYVYLLVALSNSGKDYFVAGETGIDSCHYFTPAYAVCAESCLAYYVKQFRIGIRLYGIVNVKALMFAGLFVYFAQGCA